MQILVCLSWRAQDTFLSAFHQSDSGECLYHANTCSQVFLIFLQQLKTCSPAAAKNNFCVAVIKVAFPFCRCSHGDLRISDAHELAMKMMALQKVSRLHLEETHPIKQGRQL